MKFQLAENANVIVGGHDKQFQPIVQSGKWGEAFFEIDARRIKGSKPLYFPGGVEWCHNGDEIHRYYELSNGRLEYEIILGKCPQSPVIELDIDYTPGLKFYYQPPLTKQEKQRCHRPDEVVGSYAVYWNKQCNQYRTGKVAHIMAPYLIDAKQRRVKARMVIDGKKLFIFCNPEWLKRAAYPVIVDPILGYQSNGGTSDNAPDYMEMNPQTAPEDGAGGTATFWLYGVIVGAVADDQAMGIYNYIDSTPTNGEEALQSGTATISGLPLSDGTPDWDSGSATWNTPAASTQYWLAFNGGNLPWKAWWDAADPDVPMWYVARSYTAAMPANVPLGMSNSGTIDRQYSMYVDYPGIAGPTSPYVNVAVTG